MNQDRVKALIEKYRYWNVEDDYWHTYEIEDAKNVLEKYGFSNIEVHFTGFWSQGDGASFDAMLDVGEYIKVTIQKLIPHFNIFELRKVAQYADQCGVYCHIKQSDNRYCHEYTMSISTDLEYLED